MSRVAKNPVAVPSGVEVTIGGGEVAVKGPLGTLKQYVGNAVSVERDGESLVFAANPAAANGRAMSGTVRALVNNMVAGVTKGFERKLTLVGVGYRAQAQGDKLNLTLGFSHPVTVTPPAGIAFAVDEKARTITISGIDKELVGQVASDVRNWRPPEPYKGKGLRYVGEKVRRKAGKAGKVG